MNGDLCLLTVKDYSELEALLQKWTKENHPLTNNLRQKLRDARVVFPDDFPTNVAKLGSQISYSVGS